MKTDMNCSEPPTRPRPTAASIFGEFAVTVNRWVSSTTANATEQAMDQVRRSLAMVALSVAMAVAGCSAYLVFLHELLTAVRTWELHPLVQPGIALIFFALPTTWLLFLIRKHSRATPVSSQK